MGAYKYYNPSTGKWEIIKSKSIVKPDGSLEYTPDDIKEIDDKIDILKALKIHVGNTAPTDTVFWLDTSEDL